MKDQPSSETCEMVDARDRLRCVRCGKNLYYSPMSRHHRLMRSHADKNVKHQVYNLIDLCGSGTTGCHGYVHAHPKESYENGWLVHSWDDPLNVPVKTFHGWMLLTEAGKYKSVKHD